MLIDFEKIQALQAYKAYIRTQVAEFNRDIEQFPGIVKIRTLEDNTPDKMILKILQKNGKTKPLPCLAYAIDDMGVVFCVTISGERQGYAASAVLEPLSS